MATKPATDSEKSAIRLSDKAQKSLLTFVEKIMEHHGRASKEIVAKMDLIDQAYARYKETATTTSDGVDTVAASTTCDVFASDKITPPIVVSQVDAYVAYLADVYLSGYPLFPVVSTPSTKKYAEQLETLMDDHALLGSYPRHLLLFMRDGTKYNYSGVEVDWDTITQFSPGTDFTESETGRVLKKDAKYYNKLKRLEPRNIIRDTSVLPCDVSELGDYAGYVETLSMTALKRHLLKLQAQDRVLNFANAMASTQGGAAGSGLNPTNMNEMPMISEYISKTSWQDKNGGVDWDAWADGETSKKRKKSPSYGAMYEKIRIYARIIPADHGIIAPQPNTPQIWRLEVINGTVLVAAHRVISAYDRLPILIGQPQEDGFGEQTQSVAEGEIPFQNAAETLFNIRFAAARRAVSDRALYNSNYLTSAQVNSKGAAPKIPVNINPLNTSVSLDGIYKQIPFDMRGTESTISDAQQIVQFSKELHGINSARMGQFQKGNKSVTEWNDVQSGSENRLRLPALTLEYQVFSPMKSMMALNIIQYGDNAELISQKSGEMVKINIQELRGQVLSFRIADGFTPKSKLASMDILKEGMMMINQSQPLQLAYGPSLPALFAHMMSLGGVRGLEEYDPKYQQQQAAPVVAPGAGIQNAALQGAPASLPPTEVP